MASLTTESADSTAPKIFLENPNAQEAYTKAADALENHIAYKDKLGEAPDYDIAMEEYVEFCRSRAEEEYTDETPEEAQDRFAHYWDLLG